MSGIEVWKTEAESQLGMGSSGSPLTDTKNHEAHKLN